MLFLSKIYIMLALGVSTALSLSVNAPTNPESGAQTTITWTSTSSDSTFSIELIHPSFNKALAIANNVDPTLDSITVTLPIVPVQDGYTLQFVNITNINQVFATSPDFAVAPNPSTSAATLSATAGSTTAGSASTPAASLSAGASAGAGSAALSTATTPPTASASRSAAVSGASSAASGSGIPSAGRALAAPLSGASGVVLASIGIALGVTLVL